jgi:hypothetical protein
LHLCKSQTNFASITSSLINTLSIAIIAAKVGIQKARFRQSSMAQAGMDYETYINHNKSANQRTFF